MKKIFTSILFAFGFIAAVNAQTQCNPNDGNLQEAGLSPNPDTIPCYVKGQPITGSGTVIYFKNFDQVNNLTVDWLIIDSVTNLPAGVSYTLDKGLGVKYQNSENGCINISGTPTSDCGQYRLGIYVQVSVNGLVVADEAGALSKKFNAPDFGFIVRVREATQSCPCIDTLPTRGPQDTTGVTVKGYRACDPTAAHCPNLDPLGVSEVNSAISALAISPNPFTTEATVSFYSEKNTTYTSRITNVIGKEVYKENVDIRFGQNSLDLNRNNLPAGVYFYSLSDGKGLVTKRFVVQ